MQRSRGDAADRSEYRLVIEARATEPRYHYASYQPRSGLLSVHVKVLERPLPSEYAKLSKESQLIYPN